MFEEIADLGSGMNYNKKGLKRLLDDVVEGRIGRLVITHKDRLLRFGAELVFAICEAKNVEVVILNQGEDTTFEEDLAKDVLEIGVLKNRAGAEADYFEVFIDKRAAAIRDERPSTADMRLEF